MENVKNEKKLEKIEVPRGTFYGQKCVDCIYLNPYDRDSDGRLWCNWYNTYYDLRERWSCLSIKRKDFDG